MSNFASVISTTTIDDDDDDAAAAVVVISSFVSVKVYMCASVILINIYTNKRPFTPFYLNWTTCQFVHMNREILLHKCTFCFAFVRIFIFILSFLSKVWGGAQI